MTSFRINFTNNSFQNIDAAIFSISKMISLNGNPFKCECVFTTFQKHSAIIKDFSFIKCKKKPSSICESVPFLPFGSSLIANLGSCFSIYCSSSTFSSDVFWTFPNGTKVVGNQSEVNFSFLTKRGSFLKVAFF